MVYQALFWLGEAGQKRLIRSILVAVLVREVVLLIVGLILLGRTGLITLRSGDVRFVGRDWSDLPPGQCRLKLDR